MNCKCDTKMFCPPPPPDPQHVPTALVLYFRCKIRKKQHAQ